MISRRPAPEDMAANPDTDPVPSTSREYGEQSGSSSHDDTTDSDGNTPLHRAAISNNIHEAERLLNNGSDINATSYVEFTPLHYAAIIGDALMIKLLLDRGADPNKRNQDGDSPLHIVVIYDHVSTDTERSVIEPSATLARPRVTTFHLPEEQREISVIEMILMRGADVNAMNKEEHTPLHMAALGGLAEAARLLLDYGADINAATATGVTPLYLAAESQHLEVAQLLQAAGATLDVISVDSGTRLHVAATLQYPSVINQLLDLGEHVDGLDVNENTALHLAAQLEDISIVVRLLNRGADVNLVNKHGFTPLHLASIRGKTDNVKLLLDFGAVINKTDANGNAPLHVAVGQDHLATVQLLLDREADVNMMGQRGFIPLHCALDSDEYLVNLLLNFGSNIAAKTNDGNTPLHLAALGSTSAVVELLLTCGADPNMTNKDNSTPLHVAAFRGDESIVTLLLDYDAKINVQEKYGYTPLFHATLKGHNHILELLLYRGAVPNNKNVYGDKPLHRAVVSNSLSSIQVLLNGGADPNISNIDKITPLHLAANIDNVTYVNLLLDSGADLKAVDEQGDTPLHVATRYGHGDIVKILLLKGADVNAKNKHGFTPLHSAVQHGNVNVVELILEYRASINEIVKGGITALHLASRQNNQRIMEILLNNGAAVDMITQTGSSPLHFAVETNNTLIISMLLDSEANIDIIDDEDNTPLHKATYCSKADTVELLLVKGANPNLLNKDNRTPLHLAASRGEASIVRLLLHFGANVNMVEKNGITPLYIAAAKDHKSIVELLLYSHSDMNMQNVNGDTALHIIALQGLTSILSLLLEFCVNVNITNREGNTPLFLASWKGHISVVQMLLNKEADVNIANKNGISPLHSAVTYGAEIIANVLLNSGANITAVDKYGNTPLHEAVQCKNVSMVELLLRYNADLNVMNHYGDTPLHLAAQSGNLIMMELLLQYGANSKINSLNEAELEIDLNDEPEEDWIHKCGATPLHSAVWSKEIFVVSKLIKLGTNINAPDLFGNTPLHIAAICGSKQIVKLLLKSGARVDIKNKKDYTPLHLAILGKNSSIIDMLLKLGARIDTVTKNNNTGLHMIFSRKHNNVILKKQNDMTCDISISFILIETFIASSLIMMGATVNAINIVGNSPLHLAVGISNIPSVELLINNGADPHTANEKGLTPLHLSAHNGDTYIMSLLLNLNADVNAKTKDGHTPLHLATENNNQSVVELLLNSNADVNTSNNYGISPLHTSLTKMNIPTTKLLLKNGANVHTTSKSGDTPLHTAAFSGCVEAVELLLQYGGGTTQLNIAGETPLDVAKMCHQYECSKEMILLLQAAEMSLTDNVSATANDHKPQTFEDFAQIFQSHNPIELASYLSQDTSLREFRYQKTTDTSGIGGQLYETKFLCLVHLRALNAEQIEHFILASNMCGVGDMDDICLRYNLRRQRAPVVLFLQAKHREHKKKGRLTERDMLHASGDFSLCKYFESYLAIKERFRCDDTDPMFEGHFCDVECNFVLYTPVEDDLARKKTGRKPSEMVDNLISTGQNTEPFQYDYNEDTIEFLSKILVVKRLKTLATVFLGLVMSKKYRPETILTDKGIARYHVVMARQVIQIKQQNGDYRLWHFRSEFLETNCKYLVDFRDAFIQEILTKRYDQSDIKNEDCENFQLLVENPCAATLSKLIGKLIIYNEEKHKLQLIEVTSFTKKFKANKLQILLQQLDKITLPETAVKEAVKLKLLSLEIKLPHMFGNLDMFFRGNNEKVHLRINTVADKLMRLLNMNKDKMIVEIDDHIVGPGKTIEQGIIGINGGLGSAVGNLLVLDTDTNNMLKFNLDTNNLPDKANIFLNKLKDPSYKNVYEQINKYRIKVDIIEFPICSLIADINDCKTQAREFLDNLWFYCNQAKQDEIENIIKKDIDIFYNNDSDANQIRFKIEPHDIYLEAHSKIQKWWMLISEATYLTKKSNIFESAKLTCITKLLLTTINYINYCEISRIDVKLNAERTTRSKTFDKILSKLYCIFDNEKLTETYNDIENLLEKEYNELNDIDRDIHLGITNKTNKNEPSIVFKKRSGTSAVRGHLYVTILQCLVLLRCVNDPQRKDFIFENNIKDIGAFDDICLLYELKRQRKPIGLFLQAKHREDTERGKITIEELRSTTENFSLKKYFLSYLLIKHQFQANDSNRLFKGKFDDIDCHFIIYTPAKDCITKKKAEPHINDRVHYLIQSKDSSTEVFQYDYDQIDVDGLACVAVTKQLETLTDHFVNFIMTGIIDSNSVLFNKIITRYHVVIARKVLYKYEENASREFCKWKFRPEFLNAEDPEYLVSLKNMMVKKIYSHHCDLSNDPIEDIENILQLLNNPCPIKLSKLISKVVTYNDKSEKLRVIYDPVLKDDRYIQTVKVLNELKVDRFVIREAVAIKLSSMEIKLPLMFGNADIFCSGEETETIKKMDILVDKLISFLDTYKENEIITLNDNIAGRGKIVEEEILSTIDGIGSFVGNLLVLDTNTKMLKFDANTEKLPHNAALFLNKIIKHERYHVIEPLHRFQFIVDMEAFPKYSFEANDYDKREARDFLNKLWFYVNQPKEDQLEGILKEEINKYCYNKINENCQKYGNDLQSSYLSSQARDYLQKWSMQTTESAYLSRLSDFFERAKLSDIHNTLRSVVNYLYVQKIYSVDIKFRQRVNQVENFEKLMQIFSQMSSCLFKLYDPNFDELVKIAISKELYPSDMRELVFRLEIAPDMHRVKLIMTTSSWTDLCFGCLAHITASRAIRRCMLREQGIFAHYTY